MVSPDTTNANVSLFKEIKTARDRFSHGVVRNERELPWLRFGICPFVISGRFLRKILVKLNKH
jgi:hypothetical protein